MALANPPSPAAVDVAKKARREKLVIVSVLAIILSDGITYLSNLTLTYFLKLCAATSAA